MWAFFYSLRKCLFDFGVGYAFAGVWVWTKQKGGEVVVRIIGKPHAREKREYHMRSRRLVRISVYGSTEIAVNIRCSCVR